MKIIYICRTMEDNVRKYESPAIDIIDINSEQAFLVGSGTGYNEGLYDDPNDYSDYFDWDPHLKRTR